MEEIHVSGFSKVVCPIREGDVVPGRRMGNTTRIIDSTIQELFKGSVCLITDHHPAGIRDLWRRILSRLHNEHRVIFDNNLCVCEKEHTMWLKSK